MIPTIETIVEGLLDGTFEKWRAINLLHQHAENAGRDLRDDFAACALQGLLASEDAPNTFEVYAKGAYRYADAMLAERIK